MAVTVRAVGTVATSAGGTISPAMPSGVLTNDILLLFIESAIANGSVTGGTETWTQVADSPQDIAIPDNSARARLSVYWARASQDSPTSPTVGAATNHQQGVIIAFAGGVTAGNPWDVTSGGTEQGPDTSISITGDTTTVADCLIVIACATSLPDADSTTEFSGFTNGDLTSLTERVDNTTSQGNGGGLFVATGEKATAGAYGATSVTAVTSAAHAFMTIALKPSAVAVTGTGTLVSGAAAVTGAGSAAWLATGALVSGAAAVTGVGLVTWEATGTLLTGVEEGGATELNGAGEGASTGTGALVSVGAQIIGSGAAVDMPQGGIRVILPILRRRWRWRKKRRLL